MFSWISTSSISKHLQAPYAIYAVFTHLKPVCFPALCRQATIIGMSLPWQNMMSSNVMSLTWTSTSGDVLKCNDWTESTKSAKCLACSLASVLNECSDFNTFSPREECNFKMKAMGEMAKKRKTNIVKMHVICWPGTDAQDHWEVANLPIEEFNRVNLAKYECASMWVLPDALNRLENLHWIQIESLHLVISFTCLAHVSLKGLGISAVHTCTSKWRVRHPTLFEMKRHETTPNVTKRHSPLEVGVCSPVQFVWNWMFWKRTHKCNPPNGARNLGLTTSAKTTPKLKTNFATRNRTKGRISDQWTVKTCEKHEQIRCSNVSIGVSTFGTPIKSFGVGPEVSKTPAQEVVLYEMHETKMDWLKLQMTWYSDISVSLQRLSDWAAKQH